MKTLPKTLKHDTFKSPSMGIEVGYYIYLPPGYHSETSKDKRYPVVYHLHGGRPGGEHKSAKLANFIDKAIKAKQIKPCIYVWPNGGPISWYNMKDREQAMGEDVFIKETIPHIDSTYRTKPKRSQRGLEGFSQGGRATTRIMFKYPELWGSTAPGGSGYEPEKRVQQNNGKENDNLDFGPGNNTWDLAKVYSTQQGKPKLEPLLWVGTKGFNYEFNLKYMQYLDELKIPYKKLIVEGAGHSAFEIYQKKGVELMQFHATNFAQSLGR